MKKQNVIVILILLLLICIGIMVFKLNGYTIQNGKPYYNAFISKDLNLIWSELSIVLSKNNFECSNDVVKYTVMRSLCDSCNTLIMYDIVNKTLVTGYWKIQYDENENKKINVWNIEIIKDSKKYFYYGLGKYIRQLNIVQEMTDGETVFICYKSNVYIFNNPKHGISPYDLYVKNVIY